MPSIQLTKTFIREIFTKDVGQRIPPPVLVMDDPDKNAAFIRAGREDGVMAPIYLYNCANICEVIKPGNTVVDLACGPATQLAMVARLNPDVYFIGVDLSDNMLEEAKVYIKEQNLKNVELRKCDISNLTIFEDHSIDAVYSTVSLHHLPSIKEVENTFGEVKRILKPHGGVFIIDFTHLKSEKSIHYFAYQYADRQPELFTLDYLYALQAAFKLSEFKDLAKKHLSDLASIYWMFMMPFMMAVKSPVRRPFNKELFLKLSVLKQSLPKHHKVDIREMSLFFRLGGLKTRYL